MFTLEWHVTLVVFWMNLLRSSAPQSYWQRGYASAKTAVLTVSAVHLVALSCEKAWYGPYKIWVLIRKRQTFCDASGEVTVAYSQGFHGRTLSVEFVIQTRKRLSRVGNQRLEDRSVPGRR